MSFTEYLRETLGEVEKAEIADHLKMDNGQTTVVLEGQYQNDSGTERWVFQQMDGAWHWTEFHYNAPALTNRNN